MFKITTLATSIALVFATPHFSYAANKNDLAQLRLQMQQMKDAYEARMSTLEKRLAEAESKNVFTKPTASQNNQADSTSKNEVAVSSPPYSPPSITPVFIPAAKINTFNPAIALNLSGTYANLSQDPSLYKIDGFMPNGGEIGPGSRSFNLGESELTLSASVDTYLSGQLTFSLSPENTVGVEESFIQTSALGNGSNLKVGRFLSSIGYLNNQHAHTWDFVDAPLAYQAYFGSQYKTDGLQLKWLAPTDIFMELGAELGKGDQFPGNDRNKNGFGSSSFFAHLGDDIGENASWRAGISYVNTSAVNRGFTDVDSMNIATSNTFSGKSKTWIADAIYKWSPNGNSTQQNLKILAEYFQRNEDGNLIYDTESTSMGMANNRYSSQSTGWYTQAIFQLMPQWRVGYRYDQLSSDKPKLTPQDNLLISLAQFPTLKPYSPIKNSLMIDFSPSEFSRFRLQFSRDQSRSDVTDNQIFFQYNMSLGTHAAHSF